MKKFKTVLAATVVAAAMAACCVSLAACGGGTKESAKVTKSYISSSFEHNVSTVTDKETGDITGGKLNTATAISYQLNLNSDNTYEFITSTVQYGYSMVIKTESVVTYGEFTYGLDEDGVVEVKLGKATDVILNSYSKAGGYHISINSMVLTDTDYTAGEGIEVPATTQGQKEYVKSKDELINKYGEGKTVWVFSAEYKADGTFNNELMLQEP